MEDFDEKISKRDLFKYSFYQDNGKLAVVLDEEYLKELFNADELLFKESFNYLS